MSAINITSTNSIKFSRRHLIIDLFFTDQFIENDISQILLHPHDLVIGCINTLLPLSLFVNYSFLFLSF